MKVHPGIPAGVHIEMVAGPRILLMRRAGTGFFDGLYSLPGGHIEPGESIRAAAIRELREELGVEVAPAHLALTGVVHRRSDTNRIDFFLRTETWRNTEAICEPDRCDELRWCERTALPDNTVAYVRVALEARESPWILELGW